jgi:hypothetical protein
MPPAILLPARTQIMNLSKIRIFNLALLGLIAGCDENKAKHNIGNAQAVVTEQKEPTVNQAAIDQQEREAVTRSNLELEAFERANILYNTHDYTSASLAYRQFILEYTFSSRVRIVQQRLQDIDRVLAYQNAVAQAQQAAAVAQAQTDARLRVQYQSQAPAQNHAAVSSGTVSGFGNSKGDAYAAARQKLPAGAVEAKTHYSPITQGNDHYFNCTITYQGR